MTSYNLYKAVWYWKDDHLAFIGQNEGKERIKQSRATQELCSDTSIHFQENVDQNSQKLYKQKYQRSAKPNVPNVVTIQDIKDVVSYLMIGNLPKSVMALFHSYEINPFFRTLITYMQLYLQVWEDLSYRRTAYTQQRLKHPISHVREKLCHSHLCSLRSRIGQEYALIISGEGTFKKNHHMNNTINRSYTSKDITLYEYIFKLTARVVWVALYRSNFREIESELTRLFHAANIVDNTKRLTATSRSKVTVVVNHVEDQKLLHGDHKPSRAESNWHQRSPVVSSIFINQDNPDLLLPKNLNSLEFEGTCLSGLEAAITLPEELFVTFGVSVGILGLSRDNFEAMLHVKQEPPKSLEEEEIARAMMSIETQNEKPYVKMYEFLKQLERTVDLGADEDERIIKDKINIYLLNHVEDSKTAFDMWKHLKCF